MSLSAASGVRKENANQNTLENVNDHSEFISMLKNLQEQVSGMKKKLVSPSENKNKNGSSTITKKNVNKRTFDFSQIDSPVCSSTVSKPPKAPKRARIESPSRGTSPEHRSVNNGDEESDIDDDNNYSDDTDNHEDAINPYASQTDGYDTDYGNEADNRKNVMNNDFEKILKTISTIDSGEGTAPEINESWAKIVQDSWWNEKSKEQFSDISKKYSLPKNCQLIVPSVNVEMWNLLSKFQKKADLKFQNIQKTLVKTVAASLDIVNEVLSHPNYVDTKKIVQITTDCTALLGHAAHELSLKRRTFIRSVLKEDYKDLCNASTEMSEKLFGDNLSKHMKDLNMRNKMKSQTKYSGSNNGYTTRPKPYYNPQRQSSFLGKGRRDYRPPGNSKNHKRYGKKN